MKFLAYLLLSVGLLGGAAVGGAVTLGHPADPRDWPIIVSSCSVQDGELTITESVPLLGYLTDDELYQVTFRADGRNMAVSGRRDIFDVPMSIFEDISFSKRRITIVFDRGLTSRSEYVFRRPNADCGDAWREYAIHHPKLMTKAF